MIKKISFISLLLFAFITSAYSQKTGFISSQTIRENFTEAKQAETRIQSFVEEWKRELASMQKQLEDMQFEINKNRLVWTDEEKASKQREFIDLKTKTETYAKGKFEPNGEYDNVVKQIMAPIEQKIFAAVQEVAADNGFDIIFDQSNHPMPYVNFKYDVTVKVLKRLGVDVEEMEKELQDKIQNDPRNQIIQSKNPRTSGRQRNDPNAKEPEPTKKENTPSDKKTLGPSRPPIETEPKK